MNFNDLPGIEFLFLELFFLLFIVLSILSAQTGDGVIPGIVDNFQTISLECVGLSFLAVHG